MTLHLFLRSARRTLAVLLLGLTPLAGVYAQDGVDVGRESAFAKLVPAAKVEQEAALQYDQLKAQAAAHKALAPDTHPQLVRLRRIAQKIIPLATPWNTQAAKWKWEINLIGSRQVNAFCMPGGKIAFYTGILDQLKLTDDEAAVVMGHEIAHALREHARARMGKSAATSLGASILGQVLGTGALGQQVINGGAQLLTLKFSRGDESEADLIGMELAARAGYDPRSAVTLWRKMGQLSKNAPPEWLSTHPAGNTRIADIEANLPRVMPLYEKAREKG